MSLSPACVTLNPAAATTPPPKDKKLPKVWEQLLLFYEFESIGVFIFLVLYYYYYFKKIQCVYEWLYMYLGISVHACVSVCRNQRFVPSSLFSVLFFEVGYPQELTDWLGWPGSSRESHVSFILIPTRGYRKLPLYPAFAWVLGINQVLMITW